MTDRPQVVVVVVDVVEPRPLQIAGPFFSPSILCPDSEPTAEEGGGNTLVEEEEEE